MNRSAMLTPILLIFLTFAGHAHGQKIIAHRGASADAPENTIAAFKLGYEQQADGMEGDFYLTKDKRIVAIHDKTTKRTSNQDLVVAKTTLAELQKLDVGSWKSSKYANERIPTLDDVLDMLPEGKIFLIEIKTGPEIIPYLTKVLNKRKKLHPQLRVIAFNKHVIAASKKQLPNIKAYWLTSYKKDKETDEYTPSVKSVFKTLKEIKADGLASHANRGVLVPEFVKQLRDKKYEFHSWTVNKAEDAKWLKSLGVDSIITDKPAYIRTHLK